MSQDAPSDRDRAAQSTKVADRGDIDWGLQLEPGSVLGDRYQIRAFLGCGGMGEVWHADDLKLRVEVALKGIRPELLADKRRRESLRTEVRAAREVVSPNVCRIFDLIEIDGSELVSMEYVDGGTLLEVLQDRGPLELKEAQDIASQFLAGLEAIHQAGLVHRDVKPENIMITRAGRVVLMDLGLARQEAEGGGSVSGTPAYMAPEQAAGQTTDARADVYAAGVVLAEMVCPEGIKSLESRQSVWDGVRSEPAKVPDTPWAPVLKKAVAKKRSGRYNTAHTLTRALEDVTLRVEGAEDLHPYPGLESFTESDAEYFFGREAETEAVWRRLGSAHLLAIVGPSGAGKTSFIGAGLVPNAPADWAIVRCTPGNAAIPSLARAMAREMAGDADAVEMVVDIDDPGVAVELFSRWRRSATEALLIVDQFEELFTQNTAGDQRSFAGLLGRLSLESDVRVLLSMRDDFLMQCNSHEALRPVFSELTPLGAPVGPPLRRALVQPATKCGYRFEDDELAEEMLAEVEGERGALPLLAFAAARLWEKRDRDRGLLTRRAYHDIGGVGGALAQHAEATIDRIGADRIAIVRDLFRNLVTKDGTRAVREWNELLSIFRNSRSELPAAVLSALIDARLLTSYEVKGEDRAPTRRVEIIHESLLANWPRLVGWRTQDADSARLRDELRQAARTWHEHGRTDDRLWTGSAYREFAVWCERYPGGFTELEGAFGVAMTRHSQRRRRRRRTAVAATFVALLAVLAVIGGFWRRSIAEARRAEAANLFSLAQLQLEDHPSATIAYLIASLELADHPEARRLAVEALWLGPTETRLPTRAPFAYSLDFSPDGRWLATVDPGGQGRLWPSDGGPPVVLEDSYLGGEIRISPRGDLAVATVGGGGRDLRLWSVPEGRFLRSITLGEGGVTYAFQFSGDGEHLIASTETQVAEHFELELRSWPVAGGEPRRLARLDLPAESGGLLYGMDPTGSRFAWADGSKVQIAPLDGTSLDLSSATSVEHDRTISFHAFDKRGSQITTADTTGTIRVWSLANGAPELTHSFDGWGGTIAMAWFNHSGSALVGLGGVVWDLDAPPETEPLRLRSPLELFYGVALDPDDRWLVTSAQPQVSFWPLGRPYPRILRSDEGFIKRLAFTPDGGRLVSESSDGSIRLWPLRDESGERSRLLFRGEGGPDAPRAMALAPDGSFVAFGNELGHVNILPVDGGPLRELRGTAVLGMRLAVGPRSRLVASGFTGGRVRVWDLETDEVSILDAGDGERARRLQFSGDDELWATGKTKIRRWRLDENRPRIVEQIDLEHPEHEGRDVCEVDDLAGPGTLLRKGEKLWFYDRETSERRELSAYGRVDWCRYESAHQVVVTYDDSLNIIRIGRATGDPPHLLIGQQAEINFIAVSPDGRWIASGGDDDTICLWPMPDLTKPPLHTLPRSELIAKLKSLTNLRVVRDPDDPTGWKIVVGPFPGWETVPSW